MIWFSVIPLDPPAAKRWIWKERDSKANWKKVCADKHGALLVIRLNDVFAEQQTSGAIFLQQVLEGWSRQRDARTQTTPPPKWKNNLSLSAREAQLGSIDFHRPG